ncbi:N-acetyl sugar amidotransferase [Desulfamplus magnetovallimortis]|uniref:N-acetyl sugar amidotransferase n=1 Tax=Desulfamplus magnetovallimortis TaxID=1246637 RepID=A0A1W1HEW1_9BACT|nr:N-acetyl sugar amidotransferase [Desulfamplus magnetovallimortis]SLM30966.1 N-acetyl sugar amidotransferase [Desulfamplus magnetovallimortis]
MREPVDVIKRYNLPEKVKFCKCCVISNQRPRICLDDKGICSACRFAERKKKTIDWNDREKQLIELLDRHRSKNGKHDVVVPASGGKDSAFVAHQLKYKYGMRPLTVTWAPALFTDVGWRNFQNFIQAGFDNILCTPNPEVHRKLTRLGFEHLAEPFQPFAYGVKNFATSMAVKYQIPLIMYGENGEVEYGGDSKNEEIPTHNLNDDLERHYFSNMGPLRWLEYGIKREDLALYLPPPAEELQKLNAEAHFFGFYKKWIPQENYYYAMEHTGFEANPDGRSEGTYSRYASLDDKLDGFHFWMAYIKFGIGRATSDAAHEIRDGHLTREEGVALVRRFDGEFPKLYFKDFLDYTRLTEDEFWEIVNSYRSPHIWKQTSDGEWQLKHEID